MIRSIFCVKILLTPPAALVSLAVMNSPRYRFALARLTPGNLLGSAAATLAALLLSSCASTPSDSHARFHDQDACDAIVRFSSWDLITINKPDTREDNFLPLFHLPEAEKVLARPDFPHHLAVVIYGRLLSTEQEANLQKNWAAIFEGLGYRRLVFLQAGFQNQVNGLVVLKELQFGGGQIAGRN